MGMTFADRLKYPCWDNKQTKPVTHYRKICFVTTCKDRTEDLARNYIKNIESTITYPNLEYVLIDYKDSGTLAPWVKANLMPYIERGIVSYYQVIDEHIKYYDMSHSRNIGFRLAGGIENINHDILIHQVDADNSICPTTDTPYSLADYLNIMATEMPERTIFIKSFQRNHGRIGLYKDEFVNIIGGYCEQLKGYGADDTIVFEFAARHNKFAVAKYTGTYASRDWTSNADKSKNLEIGDWKLSEKINTEKADAILATNPKTLNEGFAWGKATVIKNFKEQFSI